jgi:hypothetical protein
MKTQYLWIRNRGVMVFIFTKDNDWASAMIKIIGGTRIFPLQENVDNDWDGTERFSEDPRWNGLKWTVDSIVPKEVS